MVHRNTLSTRVKLCHIGSKCFKLVKKAATILHLQWHIVQEVAERAQDSLREKEVKCSWSNGDGMSNSPDECAMTLLCICTPSA